MKQKNKKTSTRGVLRKNVRVTEITHCLSHKEQQERIPLVFFFCFLVPSHQGSFLTTELCPTHEDPWHFFSALPTSPAIFYLSLRTGCVSHFHCPSGYFRPWEITRVLIIIPNICGILNTFYLASFFLYQIELKTGRVSWTYLLSGRARIQISFREIPSSTAWAANHSARAVDCAPQ